MSVRVMSRVWEMPDIAGTELLVLLALADFADDSGSCWPSMETIAAKTRLSDRGARKIIRRLEEKGVLICDISRGGRKFSSRYTILTNPEPRSENKPQNPEPETGNDVPGCTINPEQGGQNPEQGGQKPGTVVPPNHRTVKEPSEDYRSPCEILASVLSKEDAAAVVDHRKKLRKPLTEEAAKRMANQLRQCEDPAAAVNEMLLRGWQGIKAEWMQPKQKGNGNGRASRLMQMADGLDRRAEAEREMDYGEGTEPSQPLLPAVGGRRH